MDPPQDGLDVLEPDSGLPPTPPTMTNSDVSDSKPDRKLSPLPLFADRVRNALESQKSGLSTPVLENHSPPTPDPSPPGTRENLYVPRPNLSHSPSSYADSFKTAREGLSASSDPSREHSPFEDEPSQQQKAWLQTTQPVRLGGLGLLASDSPYDNSSDEHVRVKNYQLSSPETYDSDRSQVRGKNYVFSGSEKNEESDRDLVRIKNYQMESDSEWERPKKAPIGDDSSPDQPSPSLRKTPKHNMRSHSLRKPFQPGDDIKRPDQAMLYGSLGTWKGRKNLARPKTPPPKTPPPRREKDTTFLRNVDLVPPQTPESLISLSPESPDEHVTPRQPPKSETPPREVPSRLREFAPSDTPTGMLSPPNTATKERSLEENNIVYKMIQEENAKRHSAISDGSVQAKVVAIPESKKKLRHTKKRESLRGDVSLVDSKRSSSESEQKLRHKRGVNSFGGSEATPEVTPERRNGSTKFSSRISRFNPGENGFDYWSAIPDSNQLQDQPIQSIEEADDVPGELGLKPRRLRRSLRENSLDRKVSGTDFGERPWSMGDYGQSPEMPSSISPALRRSSADRQLDRNKEVRRTSLSHEGKTLSQKLGIAAQDLTREGYELSDQSSIKDRRRSSDNKTATSPRRKTFDSNSLRPMGTPLSTSQFSAHTGLTEAEIGEARGVEIFPHNNDSLLLIQQSALSENSSLPLGLYDHFGHEISDVDETQPGAQKSKQSTQQPTFQAFVEGPSDSPGEIGKPQHSVDSPLTNPRAAPAPPVIQFIPPTPNEELERSLEEPENTSDPRKGMQRRLSLSQRVRRYSESVFQPFPFGRSGSVRKAASQRPSTASDPRPTHLSSFWQPRDFWEEYDSEDSLDGEEDLEHDALPPGGDTSNIAENNKRRTFLPRNMSVRMPGFRGNGGFLVGNSLGLDRHGTNKRRHYIDPRASEEMLRRLAMQQRRRTFTLPFSGGAKVEYVGLTVLKNARKRRQERALEKRREKLRGQIGTRVFHDGRCGVS